MINRPISSLKRGAVHRRSGGRPKPLTRARHSSFGKHRARPARVHRPPTRPNASVRHQPRTRPHSAARHRPHSKLHRKDRHHRLHRHDRHDRRHRRHDGAAGGGNDSDGGGGGEDGADNEGDNGGNGSRSSSRSGRDGGNRGGSRDNGGDDSDEDDDGDGESGSRPRGTVHDSEDEGDEDEGDDDEEDEEEDGDESNQARKAGPQGQRYLRIRNATGAPLTVFVQYRTLTGDNAFEWLPAAPDESEQALRFDIEAGEALDLANDGTRIAASRVRLWARSPTRKWTAYKGKDLWLVPEVDEEGEHSYSAPAMETFTFTFKGRS
jgi:hypothetical protein